MDPFKEIAELKAKRTALEQQLAAPGIDKDRELAIRRNMDTIGNEITALYGQLPPPPPPPDNRSFLQRKTDEYWGASMLWDLFFISGSWMALRFYSIARHNFAPYTEKQLIWRQWALFFDSPNVPNAKRVFAASGFFAVMRGWTNKSPPPNWTVGLEKVKQPKRSSGKGGGDDK